MYQWFERDCFQKNPEMGNNYIYYLYIILYTHNIKIIKQLSFIRHVHVHVNINYDDHKSHYNRQNVLSQSAEVPLPRFH